MGDTNYLPTGMILQVSGMGWKGDRDGCRVRRKKMREGRCMFVMSDDEDDEEEEDDDDADDDVENDGGDDRSGDNKIPHFKSPEFDNFR